MCSLILVIICNFFFLFGPINYIYACVCTFFFMVEIMITPRLFLSHILMMMMLIMMIIIITIYVCACLRFSILSLSFLFLILHSAYSHFIMNIFHGTNSILFIYSVWLVKDSQLVCQLVNVSIGVCLYILWWCSLLSSCALYSFIDVLCVCVYMYSFFILIKCYIILVGKKFLPIFFQ